MSTPSLNLITNSQISSYPETESKKKKIDRNERVLHVSDYCSVILQENQVSFGHCRIVPKEKGASFLNIDFASEQGSKVQADIQKCSQLVAKVYTSLFKMTKFDLLPEGRSFIEGEKACKKGCHHFIPHYNESIEFANKIFTDPFGGNSIEDLSKALNGKSITLDHTQIKTFIELFQKENNG